MKLTPEEKELLLQLARGAIRYGARHGVPPEVRLDELPPALRQPGATFVTLEENGKLRGCIGSLEPRRPLAEDVVHNAFAAAFYDPRFPPVQEEEVDRLKIKISLLSPLEPIECASEEELLSKLRPGIDGLLIEAGPNRGTFLPEVWKQLPDPKAFLRQLKIKAGLLPDEWPEGIRVWRYTTSTIEEEASR